MFHRVVENDIGVLNPTVCGEWPGTDTEYPAGKELMPGQKLEYRQRIVQTLLPGREEKHPHASESIDEPPRARDVERPVGMRRVALRDPANNAFEAPETQR